MFCTYCGQHHDNTYICDEMFNRHAQPFTLPDDKDAKIAALESANAALKERLAAVEKDTERLDWYEVQHGLHTAVEVLYVVDGYDLSLTYNGDSTAEFHGDTVRVAIDAAIAAGEKS
jgi:hypothetical protein